MNLDSYIENIYSLIPALKNYQYPWEIISNVENIILELIKTLSDDFKIENNIAIHKKSVIENNLVLKSPAIINEGCFIAANSYFRGGIYLGKNVKIGPSCEVKSSFVFDNTTIAHLNYIGNSIIGKNVNLEGGSVVANHLNEKKGEGKEIKVLVVSKIVNTKAIKFGALIGDDSKIGANAVTSPGTILKPKSIIKRLELVEQVKG